MNLPNKLTVLRVLMIPLFLFFVLAEFVPLNILWALAVFGIASATDWFDGMLARKYGLVTNFGKFLDPLADKILVMSAIICFAWERWVDPVAVILILSREFMVSGLRMVVANEGVVVPAGLMGKLKTAFTMVALVAIMGLQIIGFDRFLINEILIWICTALTIVSGISYLKAYWAYIDSSK
ncbi:MAG: CDP-diacylglycerol--glycerol-3-phosphate 3-phosphatidyltransferase [Oscillospiraceae bacterium]